ncbi:AzlD domain-containing protein [Nocardioides sp. AE5]|uniref:AzlD domain-containing protein n=1 Tax=Nocardioides sp. AE5 TaxID=2962573 RepID=UPI0028820D11|nr:AzlD domain-containing protein [Nocardioides sp. AE5]MDT0203028.1 AzlD domain-containing protein [Nocardioides sp. AE5]
MSTTSLVVGALLLGAATFAIRATGPLLHSRLQVPARLMALMSLAATVLLVALLATSALFDGQELSDPARPAGVAVGGVLAWRRAPFVVVVLAAAGTAALIRALGG